MNFLKRKVAFSTDSLENKNKKNGAMQNDLYLFLKRDVAKSLYNKCRQSMEKPQSEKIALNDRNIIQEDHSAAMEYIYSLEEEKERIQSLEAKCKELKEKLASLGKANDSLKYALKTLTTKHAEHAEKYNVSMAEVKRLKKINKELVVSIGMLEHGNNAMDQNIIHDISELSTHNWIHILHDMSDLSCPEKLHTDDVINDNQNWSYNNMMKSSQSSTLENETEFKYSITSDLSFESLLDGSVLDETRNPVDRIRSDSAPSQRIQVENENDSVIDKATETRDIFKPELKF